MIDPSSIAFDIDDVFADTVQLFLEIARDEYHLEDIRYEDITSYMVEECLDVDVEILSEIFIKILDGSHTAALRPAPHAAKVIAKLAEVKSPVLFVTARPNLESIIDWIHATVPVSPDCVDVVATGSFDGKTEVLSNRGISCFVEDRLETCFTLQDAGIQPVVFKQPWNRRKHPFVEVGSWLELAKLLGLEFV